MLCETAYVFWKKAGNHSVCYCPRNLFYGFGPQHAPPGKQWTSEAKPFFSGKHNGKHFGFPVILLKQENKVLSVDDSFPVFTR